MTDIAVAFLKKMFKPLDRTNQSTIVINGKKIEIDSKGKILEPNRVLKPNEILQRKVDIEEEMVQNKIKLKALQSITNEELDKAFSELNVNEYISSILTLKVVESVKRQANRIVTEALEDLEDNIDIQRAIKRNVIDTIKNAFKIKE